jgi:hypothetical protein
MYASAFEMENIAMHYFSFLSWGINNSTSEVTCPDFEQNSWEKWLFGLNLILAGHRDDTAFLDQFPLTPKVTESKPSETHPNVSNNP